jgi:hypothetical protein
MPGSHPNFPVAALFKIDNSDASDPRFASAWEEFVARVFTRSGSTCKGSTSIVELSDVDRIDWYLVRSARHDGLPIFDLPSEDLDYNDSTSEDSMITDYYMQPRNDAVPPNTPYGPPGEGTDAPFLYEGIKERDLSSWVQRAKQTKQPGDRQIVQMLEHVLRRRISITEAARLFDQEIGPYMVDNDQFVAVVGNKIWALYNARYRVDGISSLSLEEQERQRREMEKRVLGRK